MKSNGGNKKLLQGFDWLTVIIITVLAILGILFITNAKAQAFTGDEQGFMAIWEKLDLTYPTKQLLWFGLGITLLFLTCLVDYHTYAELSRLILVIMTGVLALLLIVGKLTGSTTRGIIAWIEIGGNTVQPSELTKLALILVLAKYAASAVETTERVRLNKDFFSVMVMIAIPIAIIFLQGDWGTAFVFIVIIVGILFAARLKWQAIATGLIGSCVAVLVAVFFPSSGKKDPFRQARLLNFFGLTNENILTALNIDPTILQRFDTMQVDNAKMAIGSGGVTGKGFFQPGSFVQLNYLPAEHTDFVFSSAIEAVGFVGGMIILLLYFALIVRALVHAYQARDNLGYFMIIGVVAMEMAHIFENIGMNLGVMPVTGIPLPFMSYGGSSMWTNMIAFGLVLNVAMRKPGKRYRKASQAPLSIF